MVRRVTKNASGHKAMQLLFGRDLNSSRGGASGAAEKVSKCWRSLEVLDGFGLRACFEIVFLARRLLLLVLAVASKPVNPR
jgi:hypothetical protein